MSLTGMELRIGVAAKEENGVELSVWTLEGKRMWRVVIPPNTAYDCAQRLTVCAMRIEDDT